MRRNGTVRCAIYTRKSSEEGLEQEFNSLQAQREACEAFIDSQRHEGWVCLRAAYDDGGFSGATMDRPALRQLLADISAGRVDTVVVYKIDRLTRSLADFAKIVEILDAKGASFVSVTQQFNTTTSMGRLTLNVLLSFAQFEREVIGERIRDKIAASKKKGMWMGGRPPLGYRAQERKLVIVDSPPQLYEARPRPRVSLDIAGKLGQPIIRIRGGLLPAERAVVLVPKAPVHKDDLVQARKDKIGRARQIATMQTVAESQAVNEPADQQLGLRIRLSDAAHTGAKLRRRGESRHCAVAYPRVPASYAELAPTVQITVTPPARCWVVAGETVAIRIAIMPPYRRA